METSSDVRLGPAARGGPVIHGRMSQLGQKLPCDLIRGAAALPPKAAAAVAEQCVRK
jgi:hypothetical protein